MKMLFTILAIIGIPIIGGCIKFKIKDENQYTFGYCMGLTFMLILDTINILVK